MRATAMKRVRRARPKPVRAARKHRDTNSHRNTDHDDAEDDEQKLLLSHFDPLRVGY